MLKVVIFTKTCSRTNTQISARNKYYREFLVHLIFSGESARGAPLDPIVENHVHLTFLEVGRIKLDCFEHVFCLHWSANKQNSLRVSIS